MSELLRQYLDLDYKLTNGCFLGLVIKTLLIFIFRTLQIQNIEHRIHKYKFVPCMIIPPTYHPNLAEALNMNVCQNN